MSVRLFLDSAHEGENELQGARLHYLSRVLRLGVDDELQVFDGKGQSFDARVLSLSKDSAKLQLSAPKAAPLPRRISILQGLPKGDKLELVLQKGTELGASEFIPVAMARSVVKLSDERAGKKVQRWQRIAEEAARQCGRADVPTVREPAALDEAVRALPEGTALLVLDEEERALPLSAAALELSADQPVAFVIGPEGGLDRDEVSRLIAHGAKAVTMGRRVLRTETAALVALSILQLLDGELG